MERIKITNFSILENIEFEVNKINLLIGEQASGKSRFGIIQEYVKNQKSTGDKKLKKLSKAILKASYHFDGKDECLLAGDKKVLLRDSSTGQQELVYLLLFLTSQILNESATNFFIVEEPGAHIFPSTQKQLVDLFAGIFNEYQKKTGFFLTTHSPYILTCFNNLIQGFNTYHSLIEKKEKGLSDKRFRVLLDQLNKIVPEEMRIPFEDLSVFLIDDGKLVDIKDYQNKLLNVNPIDDVSEGISEDFDKLLDIKYDE